MNRLPPDAGAPDDVNSASYLGSLSDEELESAVSSHDVNLAHSSETHHLQIERERGAAWFYWIAALSLANTIFTLFVESGRFDFGLGITQIVERYAESIAQTDPSALLASRYAAVLWTIVILGFFVMCGSQARKGNGAAFLIGGFVLLLDVLVLARLGLWVGAAIHLWALVNIYGGYQAHQKLVQREARPSA